MYIFKNIGIDYDNKWKNLVQDRNRWKESSYVDLYPADTTD